MNISVSEERTPDRYMVETDQDSRDGHAPQSNGFDASVDNASSASASVPMESAAEKEGSFRTLPDQQESSHTETRTASTETRANPSTAEVHADAPKPGLSVSKPEIRKSDVEITRMFVIPDYLRLAMVAAVQQKEAAYSGDVTASEWVEAPPFPLIVMINSKSGGRLGPTLRTHLDDLISRDQVYDLAKTPPADFFRYGLRCLENLAQSGDRCAQETRERIRVVVAGGDGTVGWVLDSLTELHDEQREPIPPVGIIPLGTGNDLARSFGWGGSFPFAWRSSVKKYLLKAAGSTTYCLDSWQVVVKALPNLDIEFPHALRPQHAPIPKQECSFVNSSLDDEASFEGVFYNYFSIGMDAQVAYGFHHLRNKTPYLARGPVSNKLIYSGYSCTQGWFCTPCSTSPRTRGLRNIMRLEIKGRHNSDWITVEIPPNVRAVVILNLQSYASGRNPWGHPNSEYNEKRGFTEPKADDGMLEIFGLFDGWHAAFVMINLRKAKRLAQACSLRVELRGGRRHRAYMQMDGEPWQQPLTKSGEPTMIEITQVSKPSFMLKAN